MTANASGGQTPRREVLHRGKNSDGLARAFAAKLGSLDGPRRALAAWTLARNTLEGTMAAQRVEEGACRKGCAWCCSFQVEVRFADAAHLARRARAEPALEAQVRVTAVRVGRLGGPVARLKAAIPCAFLDRGSGACSVYEDRPLACRAYRSRDAAWCRSLVGADLARASGRPVVKEGLALRALVTEAMVAVTPAEWRAKGELHAMVVRILDTLPSGGRG